MNWYIQCQEASGGGAVPRKRVCAGTETMWRLLWVLLFVAMTAAQVANSQSPGSTPTNGPAPPDGGQGATPPAPSPDVTITGKSPQSEPLPKLPPDAFNNCMKQVSYEKLDYVQASICEHELDMQKHIVIEACIDRSGKTAPARVVQACTESLDRKILEGDTRYFIFVNRAAAYFAQGDKQHALEDYNQAVSLAPRNADLYYNRAVFQAAQAEPDAALRDLDAAIGLNAKLVPALRERGKIYQARNNFPSALADYSEAIRLEPKTAALWSERGYVYLRQHDYESALQDEIRAVELDPKLARAYYLRGAAYGDLGNSRDAVSDLVTAVKLDPSLDQYIKSNGKTALVTLPPE
jgi:tetratricopeptide (TPR) repeat protein